MDRETRSAISLRAEGAGDAFVLRGTAATFNSLSHDLGGFRELIKPGAFTRVLATSPDVRALFNHSADHVLGRTTSGTLKLEQDNDGLQFRCALDPNQQAHRDLYAAVKRGDINACSFAFSLAPSGDDDFSEAKDERGKPFVKRTIRNISNLFDVSVVVSPAYPSTTVAARSFVNTLFPTAAPKFKTDRELHALLLKYGNPEQQARALRFEARYLARTLRRDQELLEQSEDARIDAEREAEQIREMRRAIWPWERN